MAMVAKSKEAEAGVRRLKDSEVGENLLLPDGVPAERQRAKFIVRVYRADGLPRINSSIMANVKKAFTGDTTDLIDPYVQISFAGLSGRTSVRRGTASPVWNEQVVFTEMFPPLCQRMKLQLRDNDAVNDTVIATHFLDLTTVSNDGDRGFLPTFGPAWVYLYGSTRGGSVIDEHTALNAGQGEGIAYRGRILISVRVQISDVLDLAISGWELENTLPIQEATMVEKRISDKHVSFELSMGNAGNNLDGSSGAKPNNDDNSDDEDEGPESVSTETCMWQSSTPTMKPMTHDKTYYFMPFWDDKPSLYVRGTWQDHKQRLFNSNVIDSMAHKLEEGLTEVSSMMEEDNGSGERRLKEVLEQLMSGCSQYVCLAKTAAAGATPGKTKLDKERLKLCQREIEQMAVSARQTKAIITKHSFRERYKTSQAYLNKLKNLVEDLPGRKASGPGGWAIQAKLQIYLWLGLAKHKKHFIDGIPKGYELTYELRNIERPMTLPPISLHYTQKEIFQLRAHMYQARSLIASDNSGLSDPFARVIFGEQCRTTQVIDETLSPTWDEMLVMDDILVYGTREEIKSQPPWVVIEVFDQDKVLIDLKFDFVIKGKSEFIGRTLARPHVKLRDETYIQPHLEWHDLFRGSQQAGELLASFELLQFENDEDVGSLLAVPQSPLLGSESGEGACPILPVPRGIRPTLARYRLEVLFWGLRDLKRIHLLTVDRPRVDVEVAGHIVQSSVLSSAKKNPNFPNPVKYIDLELPEQELYCPPITIRVVDCRSFGRFTLVGTHIISNLHRYRWNPITKREREAMARNAMLNQIQGTIHNQLIENRENYDVYGNPRLADYFLMKKEEKEEEEESHSTWWSKYICRYRKAAAVLRFQVHNWAQRSHSARRSHGDQQIQIPHPSPGLCKTQRSQSVTLRLSEASWRRRTSRSSKPTRAVQKMTNEAIEGLPSNDPIHVLVRVYIIRATDLHPMDLNGKADPYIVINLGGKRTSDKDNYISKQLNPVFGKCFEIEATFPQDSMLTVQVLDWDLVGSDDMIGETKIDLENRFYSRHRATCGLSHRYEVGGYNQWRDPLKPTQILARLCKEVRVDGPHYGPSRIRVGSMTFTVQSDEEYVDPRNRKQGKY
ncbi:unnamed protein product, partial [Meganyctiphanes norvegica]